jgi:ubiquinone/menaquinone biosynthesis C-methylase UbiE
MVTSIEKTMSDRYDNWNRRAREYGTSRGGYKAICSYGAPYLYNCYVDFIHKKAFRKMLGRTEVMGRRVLDVGCGVGRWCRFLSGKGARVTGADLSKEMVKMARNSLGEKYVHFIVSPISKIDLPSESFEVVTCVTVLQHVTDETEFKQSVANIVRLLKKGGKALVMEVAPSRLPASVAFNKFFSVRTEREYLEAFHEAGASLECVFSVDVLPIKQWLIAWFGKKPNFLYWLLLNACVFLSWPIDGLFAGTRVFTKFSWHKAFVFRLAGLG